MNNPDTIRDDRREAKIEAHIEKELLTAFYVRENLKTLADDLEADPSRMRWFKGYDKADVIAQLREWADIPDDRIKDAAEDDVLAMVNEGDV